MTSTVDEKKFLDYLHEKAGKCNHCGSFECPERKSHSILPGMIRIDLVLDAINHARKK